MNPANCAVRYVKLVRHMGWATKHVPLGPPDLTVMLNQTGNLEYTELFLKEKIDVETLLMMETASLKVPSSLINLTLSRILSKELGMKTGPRVRLEHAVHAETVLLTQTQVSS